MRVAATAQHEGMKLEQDLRYALRAEARQLDFTAYIRVSAAPIMAWTVAPSAGAVATPRLALTASRMPFFMRKRVSIKAP